MEARKRERERENCPPAKFPQKKFREMYVLGYILAHIICPPPFTIIKFPVIKIRVPDTAKKQ